MAAVRIWPVCTVVGILALWWLPVPHLERASTASSTQASVPSSAEPRVKGDGAKETSGSETGPLILEGNREEQDKDVEESHSLIKQLKARLRELEEREARLREKRERLQALEKDLKALAERQAQLAKETAAAREAAKAKRAKEDPTAASLAHLIKVYGAMDPEEAALRIGKMKESLALDILVGLKEKQAANILAGVEPAKAARLSEGLRHYVKKKP
ncbi:MAG: hypothetical protein D6704_09605 [Nitrospirae bacterium]|nr:MAG: hypothetical protein D6704_09605 [Nitrospirota bacterium]